MIRKYFYALFIAVQIYAQNSEVIVQTGHTATVNKFVFSPDGTMLFSASEDSRIKMWNIETGKEMRTFSGHTKGVGSLDVSYDGKHLVSGGSDNKIMIWNIETGKRERVIQDKLFSDAIPRELKFSPDGSKILCGSGDFILSLWDAQNGSLDKYFSRSGYCGNIPLNITFSPDGKTFSAGRRAVESTILFWDVQSGKENGVFKGHLDYVDFTVYSDDGRSLISCDNKGVMKLWEIGTGKEIWSVKAHDEGVYCAVFSSDGKYIYSFSRDKTIRKFEAASGNQINLINISIDQALLTAAIRADKKIIALALADYSISLIDIETGKLVKSLKGNVRRISSADISGNGSKIITNDENNYIAVWDLGNAKKSLSFQGCKRSSLYKSDIIFSPDGNIVSVGGREPGEIKIFDIATGNAVKTFKGHTWAVKTAVFSPDGKKLLTGSADNTMKLWDYKTCKLIRTFPRQVNEMNSMSFSPDGKRFTAVCSDRSLKLWNTETGALLRSFGENRSGMIITFNSDDTEYLSDGKRILSSGSESSVQTEISLWDADNGKILQNFSDHTDVVLSIDAFRDGTRFISGSNDNTIALWDIASGKVVRTFTGHTDNVLSVRLSENEKQIVSCGKDGTTRLWDIESGKEIVKFVNFTNGEWIIITPDGYFDGSANGGELVPVVNGTSVWNIDQFAVKFNRPDIILERLASTDKELIAHYYQQYKKRLRKLGLTEDQLTSELHVPVSSIIDSKAEGKFLNINFNLSDSKYQLKRYNIYVNDVPLFGSYGKEISGSSASLSEKIELISGTNKIEISCMNEKGSESYRALTYADYKVEEKGDLYYLAFGVSQYKDSSLNLKYADKDANDLSEAFSMLNISQFNSVYTKTYTNDQATLENIKSAKDFLINSKPDDTFILFIAGHGVHDADKEATYYYLTHETDLNNLSATAANFELIEDILQGIPPRNKLFLMDTCESGEIEEGIQNTYYASADSRGLKGRGIKVTENNSTESVMSEKRTYLFEKDRYIYNDLARRSGAIVFSSSKGGELSYEKDDIQNGLFSEEIIKCLASKEADKDNNGTISTDELRDFVSKAVAASSGDLQHPTVDRDNIYQKFGFGILK